MGSTINSGDQIVFDSTKYLKLEIDKDGRWFQNGAEISHPGIRSQFFQALVKTQDGGYQVRIGREVCSVIVHDAPFVVRTVDVSADGNLLLKLSDDTIETLEPGLLWIGEGNVPYVTVKAGAFHARFSRPAYYELAKCLLCDENDGKYYFSTSSGRHEIEVRSDTVRKS